MKKASWMIAALFVAGVALAAPDPRLKDFAKLKRHQTEEFAAKLHLDVPAEAREFFKAAEAGDWLAVSNAFERIRPVAGTNGPTPGLRNVLYVPIHETFGAFYEFNAWDATLLQKFAGGLIESIPAGSIYFGGSGWGRFVITAVRDVAQTPDIFIVTQNGMSDSSYMAYLQQLYGSRIWVPGESGVQEAFQQYVAEVQARQQSPTNEVRGVEGAMAITGILTKSIFDHNKAQHEFYVQESFVIAWMYPYLEPHGLIMRLSKEPLAQLDPAVAAKDREYWDALTKQLLADPKFLGNDWGRQAFSKLRSAIGGLYAYRRMTGEAEAAFKQAITLYPVGPEGNFRLAQLYMEQTRGDDAVAVLEQLQKLDPHNDKIGLAIEQVRKLRRQADSETRKQSN